MKICPVCKEEVRDDAAKCPHCHSWLDQGGRKTGKSFTLTFDEPYVRYSTLLVSVLSIIVLVGAILYGVDLKKAGDELANLRLLNREIREMFEESKRLKEEAKKELANSREELKQLHESLEKIRGGSTEYDSLKNALTSVSEIQKSVGLLDSRFRALENQKIREPEGDPRPHKANLFSETDRKEIEAAIHVNQRATPAIPALEQSGRKIVELEYTVTMDSTPVTQKYEGNKLIEKVVYRLDEKWFSNPESVNINREDNFKMSMQVWGITSVQVDIFLRGSDKAIERKHLMSLTDAVVF